jgi:peptide/nickel transport system substrate-binding protein
MDAEGNIVNKLAASWNLASDLSQVTITVRDGVRFHSVDGQDFGEFSADDVVFTMNDANANTNPTSIHGQAGDFAALFGEVTKVDDTTVVFPFVTYDLRWQGNFLNEQAQGTAFFSKKAFDTMGRDWMIEHIIGTGPFQVVEWVQDDRAVMEAVDYEHWFKTPDIQTLRFIEVADPSTRVAQLRSGQVDIASDVPLKDIRPLTDDGFRAEAITGRAITHELVFSGNYWETHHARTGEELARSGYCAQEIPWVSCESQAGDVEEAREVRWALAKAIDRQLLVETILDGFGDHASLEYIDNLDTYFQDRWAIPYSPEQAQEHMDKTAWPEGNFDIGIWTGGELGGSSGTNAELNDAIAGMWLALWPDMRVEVFKSAYSIIRPSLVGRTNSIPYAGECDEGATTIPFDWPHGLTETSYTRGGFGCGIEIPRIAETFPIVSNEPDLQERVRLNTELVDYLVDQMLFAGTVQVPNLTLYNPNSISEWQGTSSIFASMNEFEAIVLAR